METSWGEFAVLIPESKITHEFFDDLEAWLIQNDLLSDGCKGDPEDFRNSWYTVTATGDLLMTFKERRMAIEFRMRFG